MWAVSRCPGAGNFFPEKGSWFSFFPWTQNLRRSCSLGTFASLLVLPVPPPKHLALARRRNLGSVVSSDVSSERRFEAHGLRKR
jgi:hypothetical protein